MRRIKSKLNRIMLEMCSCFGCVSNVESLTSDGGERSHHSYHCRFMHTRCLSPQFPGRTGRSMKGLCLLTAILAFGVGIFVGVLIPIFLSPVNGDLFPSESTGQLRDNDLLVTASHFAPPQPVMMSPLGSTATTTDKVTVLSSADSSSSYSVSSRFPEFAQIEALREDDGVERTDKYPVFRRPSPNVQFVPPDSRILSLHPVKQEIPQARFNLSLSPSSPSSSSQLSHKSASSGVRSDPSNRVEGIYWSQSVENALPKGLTEQELKSWRRFVQESTVSKIEEGCGRMQNRLLTLENSTRACCRYRQNFDQIQGEIFSFYLGQLLHLRNLAPSALALIQPSSAKWTSVRPQLTLAQWAEEKPVVFTRFIPNLVPAYIPTLFRDSSHRLHPMDVAIASNSLDSADVTELAQWSDLVIFDYLTANLDRMVNNLYNLQWNPSMMEAPAHNLAKDASTGLLVFLDNESGLLHGYRLLDKYEQYHRIMLDSLCVFRRSTANAVKRLYKDKNVSSLLKNMFHSFDPDLIDFLPMLPDKSIKILNHRIERVYEQITKCESLYMSPTTN